MSLQVVCLESHVLSLCPSLCLQTKGATSNAGFWALAQAACILQKSQSQHISGMQSGPGMSDNTVVCQPPMCRLNMTPMRKHSADVHVSCPVYMWVIGTLGY